MNRRQSIQLSTLLTLLPALFVWAPEAHAGYLENLLKSCTSQVHTIPDNVAFPVGRSIGIVPNKHYPLPDGMYEEQSCSDFTWVKLKGGITGARISWAGRTTRKAFDCQHSTMVWGMYKRNANGQYSWVGGGGTFGYMPGGDGGTCRYEMTNPPALSRWGSYTAETGTSAPGEYRIAFSTWSHDDPHMHPGINDCEGPTHCNWPIRLTVFGTYSAPYQQDWVVWRPGNGTWVYRDATSAANWSASWGQNGDLILPGDYDGDYQSDLVFSRRDSQANNRRMYVWKSSTNTSYYQIVSGSRANDQVVRNFDSDGDGRIDQTLFRSGTWLGWSTLYQRTWTRNWGMSGDIPVGGKFDDDLRSDLVVFRPSNGFWYIRKTVNDDTMGIQWGQNGDVPVPVDVSGDDLDDLVVWRPSNGTFYWKNAFDQRDSGSLKVGVSGDVPAPSYYDTDFAADLAVYRPSTNRFRVVRSSTGSLTEYAHGQPGDQPAAPFSR